jgi:hypothetical protein
MLIYRKAILCLPLLLGSSSSSSSSTSTNAAFVTPSRLRPSQTDWRLKQSDAPLSHPEAFGRYSNTNTNTNTNATAFMDRTSYVAPPAEQQEQVAVVDMSGFTSSYQGLVRPSKAGLVLAVMIAGGMAYASPERENLDISQLASTIDFTFIGAQSWDVDLQLFLSPLQETYQASLTKMQEGAAAVAAAVAATATTTTTAQGPLVEHLQAVPAQFQEWTNNLWMQVQAQTDQLASILQNALPSSTAEDFFGPVLERQLSGMSAAMGSMATQMQDVASKTSEVVQDNQNNLVPQLSAMASQMQDTVATKSAELKDTVMPQMSESMNAMTAKIQDTIAKQASQVQVSIPQMTESIGSVASKMQDAVASKASQVQIAMPDMSHVQETISSKLAEVPNVQDSVVAKVTQVQPPAVVVQEIVSAKASVVEAASVRESLASVDRGVAAQAQFDRLTQSLMGQ